MASTHTDKKKKKVESLGEHDLRTIFDNTNAHGICMLDAEGRIISWNASAQTLMGYTARAVIGKSYALFFSRDEVLKKVHEHALRVAKKTGVFTTDGIRVRKNGSHFWARSFLTLVKKESAKSTTRFVLITQDITHLRALEQKKEEYIGIASHELKMPITTLSLYSELLAKRLELDQDKKNLHMLRDIQGQAARLVTLVDDLLVVSKIERGRLELQKEIFNLHALIKAIVKDFQSNTTSHKIQYENEGMRYVRADKNRIAQVLINLLSNAIKYSPKVEKILISVKPRGKKCVVSIRDFGPGIAKKEQKEIFTRFFRTDGTETGDVAGSGLGLYISKEIIKKHNEKLWVKSIGGKGTTFSFTLSFA